MRRYNVLCLSDGYLGEVLAPDIFAAEEAARATWPDCELRVTPRA